jgi:hypothetical protein
MAAEGKADTASAKLRWDGAGSIQRAVATRGAGADGGNVSAAAVAAAIVVKDEVETERWTESDGADEDDNTGALLFVAVCGSRCVAANA